MTIEIKIPSDNKALALAIGRALVEFGGGADVHTIPKSQAMIDNEAAAPLTTADVVAAVKKEKAAITAAGADTSTDKSTTEAAGVVSSEEVGKVGALKTTSSGGSQDTNLEQSNVKQDAGGAGVATVVNGNAVDNLDEKGVGFNPAYCSKAAVPFNQTGKKKGQWKRRQGVPEADYDKWHADSLAAAEALGGAAQEEEQLETAGAFANQGDNITAIETATAFPGKQNGEVVNDGQSHQEQQGGLTFADAGEFMKWLSEQQAAELITAGDIDSAYASTQSSMGDLFDPSRAADAIAKVYNFLSNIAEGQQ